MTKEERKEFLKEVKTEIRNIRKNATDEEKGKLDFYSFVCDSSCDCIYGQMTGNCNSKRANILTPKSYKFLTRQPSVVPFLDKGKDYTALEKYLLIVKPVTHRKIIDYIKGEITTLKIN